MNDPHVVALNYIIEHDSTVKYDDAPPIEYDGPEFSVRVADEEVRLELKTHYATEDAALQAADHYIRSWELGAALDGQPGQFKLLFKSAEVVDRNPPPPTPGKVNASPITFRFEVPNTVTITKTSPKQYPPPPSGVTLDPYNPNVLTMFHRYQGYLEQREKLTDMTYFCLTMLIKVLCPNPRSAAHKYMISKPVLTKVGYLTSKRGDEDSARKADAINTDFTSQEINFLESATKAMIRRVGEVALHPEQSHPQITMSDLPNPAN